MRKLLTTAIAATLTGIALSACGGGGNVTSIPQRTTTTSYVQIERLARPAIKEVFEPFNDHKTSNAAEPYNDPTMQADIIATEDYVRPPNAAAGTDYGQTLSKLLYPDEYEVDLSKTTGGYLGVETGGMVGGTFGGRLLTDDVVGTSLAALFGSALHTIGVVKTEDGEENNCISAENLTQRPTQAGTATFPYLSVAH